MMSGDIITEEEAIYIEALESVFLMMCNIIDGGRLRESDLPDDFAALKGALSDVESIMELIEKESA